MCVCVSVCKVQCRYEASVCTNRIVDACVERRVWCECIHTCICNVCVVYVLNIRELIRIHTYPQATSVVEGE